MNKTLFVKNIVNKSLAFHELPGEWSEGEKAEVRREAIEQMAGAKLDGVGTYAFDPEVAGKRNCENLIGGVSIPLGIAGPVLINGQYAKGEFYLPLATTEGALVASINRGCKAIMLSGGCTVSVVDVGITRAPVFVLNSKSEIRNPKPACAGRQIQIFKIRNSKQITEWIKRNLKRIAKVCEGTSRHLKLLKIEPFFERRASRYIYSVFLRFSFKTGLAMGMNMATIATAAATDFIEKETDLKLVALSGNVCCDKKASLLNFQKGRGKQVHASVFLTEKILMEVLKTNAKDFYEVYRLKVELGSKVAGTIGKNCQIANVAAGIFLACGQDVAHITEAAIGETKCKLVKNGVEVSIWLPDLPMGVIGGGTGLTTQKECLQILGISGKLGESGRLGKLDNDALKLAEMVGAGVLAGEISLMAALASNDLARAHQSLARQKSEIQLNI